ncbi:MAG TPA: cob(I)yrinic acid a,c-diamide adenosyltransferase [Candidatus Polarisedimenticolia bacterium]|nr:cob(I)yrinic acid a,c-diamide adenosyltransferase [Candidatus Polarisedimenticolia bacterium]
MADNKTFGLIMVNTGNGKGKTTAALGTALRACGYGHKVLMIQFVKGPWKSGEQIAAARLSPEFELIKTGRGFFKIMGDRLPEEEHKEAARLGLELARERIASGGYRLVILDEINNAVSDGLLPVEPVLALLDAKPPELHLILTGRNAHPEVLRRAHLVTEMTEVKHPFQQGILAQKGIDF